MGKYLIRYILPVVGILLITLTLHSLRVPSYSPDQIEIIDISLTDSDSIVNHEDNVVMPIRYSGIPEFSGLNPEVRKNKFIQLMLPAILIVRHELLDNLEQIKFIEKRISYGKELNPKDTLFLHEKFETYKCNTIDELKKRISPHPVSLVLAQAALESGWGTSRFFREGYNIFGVWSYSENDFRMKSGLNRSDNEIYVKAYNDYIDSVHNYYRTIGRVNAYKEFREKRTKCNNSLELSKYLNNYAEEGAYISLITSIIKDNNLSAYDNFTLDNIFIKRKTFLLAL